MRTKQLTFLLLVLSLAGAGIGYVLDNSIKFGICIANSTVTEASCINFYERIGSGIFSGMLALSFIFIVLLIIPKAFSAWKKFAIWATPIVALIFATYSGSGGFDMVSPDPETLFKWISILYVVVSLVIIGIAARKKA